MRNKPYFDMTSGSTRTGFYHANVYVGMVWLIYLESNVSEAVVSDSVIQSNVYKHTRILRIMGYNEVNLKFFSFTDISVYAYKEYWIKRTYFRVGCDFVMRFDCTNLRVHAYGNIFTWSTFLTSREMCL